MELPHFPLTKIGRNREAHLSAVVSLQAQQLYGCLKCSLTFCTKQRLRANLKFSAIRNTTVLFFLKFATTQSAFGLSG